MKLGPEFMPDEEPAEKETLADVYGMRCPYCKQTEHLQILIESFADLTAEEGALSGDCVEWNDASPCVCPKCMHEGLVKDFRIDGWKV